MPIEGFDLPDPDDLATASKRRLALIAALIAFVGAGVLVLHTHASVEEARSLRGAQQALVERWGNGIPSGAGRERATALEGRLGATAQFVRDHTVQRQWWELEANRIAASRWAVIMQETEPDRAREFAAQADEWASIRDALAPSSAIADRFGDDAGGPLSTAQGMSAPSSFLPNLPNPDPLGDDSDSDYLAYLAIAGEAERLRFEAADETAQAWGSRTDAYVTTLTFVAVALLLIGLAFAFDGRPSRVLEVSGLLVGAACLFGMVWVAARDIPLTPARAQDSVVEGARLVALAGLLVTDSDGLVGAEESIDHVEDALTEYSKAIEIRPEYAEAYAKRSEAHLVLGLIETYHAAGAEYLPQYVTMYGERRLTQAGADLEHAIALGYDQAWAYASLGSVKYLAGDYDGGLFGTEQALERNPDAAYLMFNRGANLLALDRPAEAAASYQEALELIEQNPGRIDRTSMLQAARNDLMYLRPIADKGALDEVERLLASAEMRLVLDDEPRASDGASLKLTALAPAADGLLVSLDAAEAPDETPVMFSTYFRPSTDTPWDNVANAIGLLPSGTTSWTIYPSRGFCPSTGHYLVEAYVGTTKVDAFESTFSEAKARTIFDDSFLGVAACKPSDWEVHTHDDTRWVAFNDPSEESLLAVAVVDAIPGYEPELTAEQVKAVAQGLPEELPYSVPDLVAGGLTVLEQEEFEFKGVLWSAAEARSDETVLWVGLGRSDSGAWHWVIQVVPTADTDLTEFNLFVNSLTFHTTGTT